MTFETPKELLAGRDYHWSVTRSQSMFVDFPRRLSPTISWGLKFRNSEGMKLSTYDPEGVKLAITPETIPLGDPGSMVSGNWNHVQIASETVGCWRWIPDQRGLCNGISSIYCTCRWSLTQEVATQIEWSSKVFLRELKITANEESEFILEGKIESTEEKSSIPIFMSKPVFFSRINL